MLTQKPNIEEQQLKFLTELPYLALGHPSCHLHLHCTQHVTYNSATRKGDTFSVYGFCNPGPPALHHSVAWDGPQHEKPYLRCRRC